MNDVLKEVMDTINALQRLQAVLENAGVQGVAIRPETVPIMEAFGTNQFFTCPCGTPVHYGDKFCRECGRRIRWDV